MKKFLTVLRKHIVLGVLTTVPVYLTYIIVGWVIRTSDKIVVPFIPVLDLASLYGAGILILVVFFWSVGFLISNRWGYSFIHFVDRWVAKIPIMGDLYSNIKSVLHKFLSSDNTDAFSEAVLLEYPKDGLWTIGFITNRVGNEFEKKLGKGMVTVFMPLVPLPTQGILLMVKEKDVIRLKMKVQDALGYLVSLGVAQKQKEKKLEHHHHILDKKFLEKLTHRKMLTHKKRLAITHKKMVRVKKK
ncbi:MAG: DUF502 domain-containing protein [Alphaproteobacteria bacterium]